MENNKTVKPVKKEAVCVEDLEPKYNELLKNNALYKNIESSALSYNVDIFKKHLAELDKSGASIEDIKLVLSVLYVKLAYENHYNKNKSAKEMMYLLIERGIDLDIVHRDFGHSLIFAIKEKDEKLAIKLIDMGADINLRRWDDCPLKAAIFADLKAVFKKLIDVGADVKIKFLYGSLLMSLLEVRESEGNILKVIEYFDKLIEAGADIHSLSERGGNLITRILCSFPEGHDPYKIVQKLIDLGVNMNKATERGNTPVNLSVGMGFKKSLKCLCDAGADVNTPEDYSGMSPLRKAVQQQADLGIYLILMDAGADQYVEDIYGESLLDYAKENNVLAYDLLSNPKKLKARIAEMKERAKELEDLKKSVAEKDAQIAALKKANSGKGGVVSSNGRDTVNWVKIVAEKDTAIKEKDAQIAGLKEQMRLFLDSNLVLKNGKTK